MSEMQCGIECCAMFQDLSQAFKTLKQTLHGEKHNWQVPLFLLCTDIF